MTVEPSLGTVDVHVGYLRQKLEQDAKRPELIVTVRGVGYEFIASGVPEFILPNHVMRFGDWKRREERPHVAA
jgi:Transcriptional regulatory protein, C terminal